MTEAAPCCEDTIHACGVPMTHCRQWIACASLFQTTQVAAQRHGVMGGTSEWQKLRRGHTPRCPEAGTDRVKRRSADQHPCIILRSGGAQSRMPATAASTPAQVCSKPQGLCQGASYTHTHTLERGCRGLLGWCTGYMRFSAVVLFLFQHFGLGLAARGGERKFSRT